MLKSKGERLKETITLLKKLPQVGVARESYAYSQVQDLMTEWVNGGINNLIIVRIQKKCRNDTEYNSQYVERFPILQTGKKRDNGNHKFYIQDVSVLLQRH
jgi:hypothetical protein